MNDAKQIFELLQGIAEAASLLFRTAIIQQVNINTFTVDLPLWKRTGEIIGFTVIAESAREMRVISHDKYIAATITHQNELAEFLLEVLRFALSPAKAQRDSVGVVKNLFTKGL